MSIVRSVDLRVPGPVYRASTHKREHIIPDNMKSNELRPVRLLEMTADCVENLLT